MSKGFSKALDPTGEKHRKAGRLGGLATARNHTTEFYAEIGRKGGLNSPGKFKKGEERTRNAGRKGGQSTKSEDMNAAGFSLGARA